MILDFNEIVLREMKDKGISDEILIKTQELEHEIVNFVEIAINSKIVDEIKSYENLVLGSMTEGPLAGRRNMLPIPIMLKGYRSPLFIKFRSNLSKYRALKKRYFGASEGDIEPKQESIIHRTKKIECEICEEFLEEDKVQAGICETCQPEIELEILEESSEEENNDEFQEAG